MDITVTMDELEITQAIKDYMGKQKVSFIDKDVEVNLVAGRGVNGPSAVISIKNGVIAVPENRLEAPGQAMPDKKAEAPVEVQAEKEKATPKKSPGKTITDSIQNQTANLFADEPAPTHIEDTGIHDEVVYDENAVGEDAIVPETASPEVESLFG